MKHALLCTAAALAVVLVGAAQPVKAQFPLSTTPPEPWINSGGYPDLEQAEVLPDKRVILRFEAPKASEVSVSVGSPYADLHTYPMTKNAEGIWTATIDRPVPPGTYPYRFHLAGATINGGNFRVRGAEPAISDVQDVPHGTYSMQDYRSKVWNKNRVLGVYLPAAYYSEPNRRFPVLYWYGGNMGFRQTLDNLIAQKKIVPMIFVSMIEDASSGKDAEGDRMKNTREFAQEIMPLVDGRYRTIPDRDHRAMAGISHNAGATWTTGLNSLDKLSYMGLLSAGMFGGLLPRTTGPYPFALYAPWEPEKVLPGATKAMLTPGRQLKVFYMACGDIDPRCPRTKIAAEQFKTYGVAPIFESYPGGHQQKAYQPAIISFTSRLFK